jgi:hypothetical protein
MAEDSVLLEEIKERFKEAEDASSNARQAFKRDMGFRYGDQWDHVDMRKRKERGRPCFVFNRINPTIRQITNDQRQNSPSPDVVPVDDASDPKTAEVIQGMIRYILNASNSKSAFSTAFEHSVTGGFGYFRILTDYENDNSFDQEIKIKRVVNPLSVYFDPHSTELDGSDSDWAFVTDEMSKDKFKRLFGDSKLASMDSWSGEENPFILNDKSLRIAEYFYSKYTPKTLLLLSNGQSVLEDELDLDALSLSGLTVIEGRTRKVSVKSVKWVKTNGTEILESTDWAGLWIPIVPVYGEEFYLDGKINRQGMVADARDPQMAFNALSSSEIEAIALAPKAPWLVTLKNIENLKSVWDQSNENLPYLPFNPDQSGYVPSRVMAEANIGAITQASAQMAENLKSATGIFDASLGARSNETSGVAIARRTMQGQTANFHYQDHLNASLAHCGRILVDLIPKVYDAKRAVRILGNSDEIQTVTVNAENPEMNGMIYDLTAGKYDVRIQTGPSYLTKRQEAAQSMMEVAKTNPQFTQSAGDLMIKAMDWPHAQEIAERIKRTIPPQIIGEQQQPPVPPEVQAQMAQMGQVIQGLQAELQAAQNPIIAKKMEIDSKERIELLKAEKDLEIKKMELEASVGDINAAMQTLAFQIQDLQSRLGFLDQAHAAMAQAPEAPPQEQYEHQFQGQGPMPMGPEMGLQAEPMDEPSFPTGGYQSPGEIME